MPTLSITRAGSLTLVALAAAGALAAGTAVVSASTNTSVTQLAGTATGLSSPPPTAAPVYPKNSKGMSYGSELLANTPDQAPDLILAIATNGKEGYVQRVALYPQLPATPDDALREQSKENARQPRTIPVYTQDGTTIIGYFEIAPGSGKASSPE
jgi:hypothetical protein